MTKRENLHTVTHTRNEVYYFMRNLEAKRDMAVSKLNTDFPATKQLSDTQQLEKESITKYKEQISEFCQTLKDRLDANDAQKLKLLALREELEEILELLPDNEVEARSATKKALAKLPSEETINLSYDRSTLKFILKIVVDDLKKFREHLIPSYEKADDKEFAKDILRPKAYWIAKANKGKKFLEKLKKDLEKGL